MLVRLQEIWYGHHCVWRVRKYLNQCTTLTTQIRHTREKALLAVSFTEELQEITKREELLYNANKKQQFSNMHAKLLKPGVVNVTTPVKYSQRTVTALVSVVLTFIGASIFFKPESKSNTTSRRIWNIEKVKPQLDPKALQRKYAIYSHVTRICDTTSHIHCFGSLTAASISEN